MLLRKFLFKKEHIVAPFHITFLHKGRRRDIKGMKDKIEHHQARIYFICIFIAAGYGLIFPHSAAALHKWVSIVIAIVLFSMFSQIPFPSFTHVFRNRRFTIALLLVNFVVVPIVVWVLSFYLHNEPRLLLGVYLVLLVPCVDYVIIFTALGGGNEKLMLLSTPILFVLQMVLLPIFLMLFLGENAEGFVHAKPFITAFVDLIVIPLGIAVFLQIYANRSSTGTQLVRVSSWLPVPFMALTLFIIVASQLAKILNEFNIVIKVIPIYVAFMVVMPIISKYIAIMFKLNISSGRTLLFSGSTRNSLVVLPLAFALPEHERVIVSAVIVTQTIVELIGELIYIWLVPNILLRETPYKKRADTI